MRVDEGIDPYIFSFSRFMNIFLIFPKLLDEFYQKLYDIVYY